MEWEMESGNDSDGQRARTNGTKLRMISFPTMIGD